MQDQAGDHRFLTKRRTLKQRTLACQSALLQQIPAQECRKICFGFSPIACDDDGFGIKKYDQRREVAEKRLVITSGADLASESVYAATDMSIDHEADAARLVRFNGNKRFMRLEAATQQPIGHRVDIFF